MVISNIDGIKKRILEILNFINTNPSDKTLIKSKVLELEALILKEKLSKKEEKEILNDKKVKLSLPVLQHFYEIFETNLEEDFVNDLLNDRKELKNYLLYNRFVELITNEKSLANISEKDVVLFIGSGPFPITAILLSMFIKCHVDCYDKDKLFVNVSEKVINKLSLSNKVKIYNKKGEELQTNKYSVIVIALLAKPKSKILQSVWNNSIKGTRIICRTSDEIRELFYEKTTPSLLKTYIPVSKVFAENYQTISSVLLIK